MTFSLQSFDQSQVCHSRCVSVSCLLGSQESEKVLNRRSKYETRASGVEPKERPLRIDQKV